MIGTQAFQDAFESAQRSIFRLETLQYYAGDPNFDRFVAGQSWQDTDSKPHWVDLVSRRVSQGVAMQRVHVITEPWSDYVRFELTWSYPLNVSAGEDVRIITAPTPWEGPDFWMFDDQRVWVMLYSEEGVLDRVEDASISDSTVRSCLARKERALAASEPLRAVSPAG
ncbi:MAG: hypothetical protein JO100_10100 [Pseudonocardia sp.]|nr:hypothetical protein [Pseudonocardia sp.]